MSLPTNLAFFLLLSPARGQNGRMGISLRQFEQMKERVGGKTRCPIAFVSSRASGNTPPIILGIDPSLRGTGFGIIQTAKSASSDSRPRHHFLPPKLGAFALPGENLRNTPRGNPETSIPP